MMALEYDESTHTYKIDGKVVPCVSDVLREAGLIGDRWFTEEARARGSYVAIATSLSDEGKLKSVPDAINGYIQAYESFLYDSGFKIEQNEQPLADEAYGYAGTPDRVGKIGKDRVVVDIKTGQAWPHYKLQTAGYAQLLPPPVKRACVYLANNGTYKVRHHTNPRDWNVFAAALKIAHWRREHL